MSGYSAYSNPLAVALTLCVMTLGQNPKAVKPPPATPGQRQTAGLQREKETRTPAQQKMDSQLVYALKRERGESAAALDGLEINVQLDSERRTVVDITVRDAQKVGVALERLGQQKNQTPVEVLNATGNSIRARVKLDQLETIAGWPEVVFINPAQEAHRQTAAPAQPSPPQAKKRTRHSRRKPSSPVQM